MHPSTYFSLLVFIFRPSLHRSMSTAIHHHVLRSVSLSIHPCICPSLSSSSHPSIYLAIHEFIWTNSSACNELRMRQRDRVQWMTAADTPSCGQKRHTLACNDCRVLMCHRAVRKNTHAGPQRIPSADVPSCGQKRHVYLSIYRSNSLSLYIYISLSLSLSLSVYLSIYLSMSLPICFSICLGIYITICLCVYVSIFLSRLLFL